MNRARFYVNNKTHHIIIIITTVMKVQEVTFGIMSFTMFCWSWYIGWFNLQKVMCHFHLFFVLYFLWFLIDFICRLIFTTNKQKTILGKSNNEIDLILKFLVVYKNSRIFKVLRLKKTLTILFRRDKLNLRTIWIDFELYLISIFFSLQKLANISITFRNVLHQCETYRDRARCITQLPF